jgi:DNA integrity scanning protein DisA with diadenylate cyclase activity
MDQRVAIKIMLGLLISVIIFHLCIFLKFIPYEITWGGRLTNDSEMYVFETISIVVNLFLGLTLLMKGNHITQVIPARVITIILWIFLILFGLNTIGNVFAKTNFERFFAVLTLAFSILIWIILRKEKTNA